MMEAVIGVVLAFMLGLILGVTGTIATMLCMAEHID